MDRYRDCAFHQCHFLLGGIHQKSLRSIVVTVMIIIMDVIKSMLLVLPNDADCERESKLGFGLSLLRLRLRFGVILVINLHVIRIRILDWSSDPCLGWILLPPQFARLLFQIHPEHRQLGIIPCRHAGQQRGIHEIAIVLQYQDSDDQPDRGASREQIQVRRDEFGELSLQPGLQVRRIGGAAGSVPAIVISVASFAVHLHHDIAMIRCSRRWLSDLDGVRSDDLGASQLNRCGAQGMLEDGGDDRRRARLGKRTAIRPCALRPERICMCLRMHLSWGGCAQIRKSPFHEYWSFRVPCWSVG
mmetsp:Transcript_13312/g.36781  ORF Transcript_13312/g.36781 Transcript_13312/m.36781 type:complete len:302 (-) Transcript_13312:6-911(-)